MITVPKHIAMLIARFMEERITPEESERLGEWMELNDENMQMFELLTEERNTKWAKAWFREMGVRNRYIERKKYSGWYEPPSEPWPVSLVVLSVMCILLVIVLIILFQFYPELIREFFSRFNI
jgi:hypothetical protein